jgi:vacuolar-type H+-ATPase subunit D/Vma8
MFNIFKKIKQLQMTKEQLEHQNAELMEAITTVNNTNKEMSESIKHLSSEFEKAIERVRYLDGQLKMKDAQQQANTKFNDNERNY